jgi:uncharacterized protein (TIGR02391 family)
MTIKKRQEQVLVVKDFTVPEAKQAIVKLERRIKEIRSLNEKGVRYNDQSVYNATNNFKDTVLEIYGENSPEFKHHGYHRIWHGPHIVGMGESAQQQCFEEGIPQTITILDGLIQRLNEKIADGQIDPEKKTQDVFEGIQIHKRIRDAGQDLFQDRHYAEAVFASSKALIHFVQEKSGKFDEDGTPLMQKVFSPKNPTLIFCDPADASFKDEQEGLMHLFEGMALAIRNPRAHSLRVDTADRALEYICFLSLLANRLQDAVKK